MGLLGGSVSLAILRRLPGVRVVGHSHRPTTRKKAKRLGTAHEIVDDIAKSVTGTDLVIVATPISVFQEIFKAIKDFLSDGCVVTDVGSTKVLPHRWAAEILPKAVHYVGSHPIAGSEQRGIEFASGNLFDRAHCILTRTAKTDAGALRTLKEFWSRLGCSVKVMGAGEHDRILANVSHTPHVVAAALINASRTEELKLAGKGFADTSRIASGPPNIWADVLLTNAGNVSRSIDRVIRELSKLQGAIDKGKKKRIEKLLEHARQKRSAMLKYKVDRRELIS
jgi:prephenate dehydrogenase